MSWRVLITGSRDWDDVELIKQTLEDQVDGHVGVVIVSGACPTGADAICESFAKHKGWDIERHPADWERYGKRAGFIRNAEMVKSNIDCFYAFIKNNSKGATMTANLAIKDGIPGIVIERSGL